MNRADLAPPLIAALLALTACGPGDDPDDVNDDTDAATDDTDASGDDTDGDDSDPPTFPPNTYQLRILNLSALDLNLSGTDADGGAVDLDVDGTSMSEWLSLPLGTGTLTFDLPAPYNTIGFPTATEHQRIITVIGEVSGVTAPSLIFLEPEATPDARTLLVGTTGRTMSVEWGEQYYQIPTGEQSEIRQFTIQIPDDMPGVAWYNWDKPYRFTAARIPEGGVGYIINSHIAADGYGDLYFANNRAGPVTKLPSDIAMWTFNADETLTTPTFTAATPFGDVTLATNVRSSPHGTLAGAYVPADTTSVTASDGVNEVTAAFTLAPGAESAIAVAHVVDGQRQLRFAQGNPNDRGLSDGYVTFGNFTRYNLDARCYHNFGGYVAPGEPVPTFLIAPRSTLNVIASQRCNLTTATVPSTPPAYPTYDFDMQASQIRGNHLGWITEAADGTPIPTWTYRKTDDPNIYVNFTTPWAVSPP